MHRVDNHSTENGILSNSSYHHDHQTQQLARIAQDSLKTAPLAGSSTQGTMSVTHIHTYNPTYPYGYGSSWIVQVTIIMVIYSQPTKHTLSSNPATHTLSSNPATHTHSRNLAIRTLQLLRGISKHETAGGYPSSGYSNQTTLWNDPNKRKLYISAPQRQCTTSSITSNGLIITVKQKLVCAPGQNTCLLLSTSNLGSAVSGVYPTFQHPTSCIFHPSDLGGQNLPSSELPTLQTGATTSRNTHFGWKQGTPSFSNHHASPNNHTSKFPLESKASYDNIQEQQQTAPQAPNSQFPAAHQVTQSLSINSAKCSLFRDSKGKQNADSNKS
ncbi:hypothetical protein NC653_022209 [Populus alba x Populus x berolinensis]|uniref:Uncharacterized protein n=1 Tax=Populus alba x Populus x berolinensis TaxID=444605 RepID=A0AAD6QFS7_9ROSI|nr:hypothetical protein NC653_022209 [Populus alba x Populus x berolinensis]